MVPIVAAADPATREAAPDDRLLAALLARLEVGDDVSVEWIDVGGGLAATIPWSAEGLATPCPSPPARDYVNAVVGPLLPALRREGPPRTVLFEPGRTLLEPYAAAICTVLDL